MVHLQDVPDREWTWAQSGQTLERPWQKKCPRWGIHKLFFNHPQSPISGTSTKAVKQLRTLFAAWAGGMAGAADVSTAVAGAESAAFWDGNMVAVAKVVMTNGWLRVYYGLKMVHENRIKYWSNPIPFPWWFLLLTVNFSMMIFRRKVSIHRGCQGDVPLPGLAWVWTQFSCCLCSGDFWRARVSLEILAWWIHGLTATLDAFGIQASSVGGAQVWLPAISKQLTLVHLYSSLMFIIILVSWSDFAWTLVFTSGIDARFPVWAMIRSQLSADVASRDIPHSQCPLPWRACRG